VILPELCDEENGYHWESAFQCCGPAEEGSNCFNSPNVSQAIEKGHVPTTPFQRVDVKRVIAKVVETGCYAETDVLGVFELHDGRFAFLTAGCDTTGWDCQSGGHAIVDDDLDHLIRFGIGESEREKLGLTVSA
jgi:hypothetical protein